MVYYAHLTQVAFLVLGVAKMTTLSERTQNMTTPLYGARTLSSVSYPREDGQSSVSYVLPQSLQLDDLGLTPLSICLFCLLQAPIGTLERLILCQVVTAESTGSCLLSSYAAMGRMLGKSAYSVERAVAALRKGGFLLTTRVGRENATLTFSCRYFLRWAMSLLTRPEEPEVIVKINPLELVLPPVAPEGDQKDTGLAAKKEESDSVDPLAMAAPYEDEFDASVERADTLRAAGRTETPDTDEDDISFGSETAETDMGHGVRMNTNI